jgi:cytochrome c-type biogenesis protein CcmE
VNTKYYYNSSGGTNKTLKVQFAGTVSEAPDIFQDNDGVVAVGLKLKSTYHPTFANWLKMNLNNAVATLA